MTAPSETHRAILDRYSKETKARNIVSLREMKKLLVIVFGEAFHQISEQEVYQERDNMIPLHRYMEVLKARTSSIHYITTIHFPEIEITNTENARHTIRDLYVRFYMNGNVKLTEIIEHGCTNGYLSGLRTTYTHREYRGDYAHSHLPGKALKFIKFCTGSGPIKQIIIKLCANYGSVDYQMFLHTIKNYVKHESIDGVPHRWMRNIGVDTLDSLSAVQMPDKRARQLLALEYPLFLSDYKLLNCAVSNRIVEVTPTDEFSIKLAASLMTQARNRTYLDLLYGETMIEDICPIKLSNGQYASLTVQQNQIINPIPLITFKGEIKQLYVGNGNGNTNEPEPITTRHTHPAVIELLCKQFSKILTHSAIRLQNPGW